MIFGSLINADPASKNIHITCAQIEFSSLVPCRARLKVGPAQNNSNCRVPIRWSIPYIMVHPSIGQSVG